MRALLILFISFLFMANLKSQGNSLCLSSSPDRENKTENLNKLLYKILEELENCETKQCRARIFHFIGSIYYFMSPNNTETVKAYLEKAYSEDPHWVCKYSKILSGLYSDSNNSKVYYGSAFSKEWWEFHQSRCQQLCGECATTTSKQNEIGVDSSKNIVYQQKLIELGQNDQKFRSIGNIKEQITLDSFNRTVLDTLFNIYGFPTQSLVSRKCQYYAWLILHHSNDCNWTEKWIDRFLTAIQNNESESFFLDQTFQRLFSPKNGYCKNSKKAFILYLKSKYSLKMAKELGYYDY